MSLSKIAIIDYGMGNLRSVQNALIQIGAASEIVSQPETVYKYSKIILPGVGAFNEAVANLNRLGMTEALTEAKDSGVSVLGICLGMQLMCRSSEEDGFHQGFGWIDASVQRFPDQAEIKVPHIGWNDLTLRYPHYLVAGLPIHPDVYFVHSYRVKCADPTDVLATCNYGEDFTAMFARENVMGIQFHPEKSQDIGLRILKNFVEHVTC